MRLTSLLPQTDPTMQSAAFEQFLESHLTYVLDNFIVEQREIKEETGMIYKGDFYGLVRSIGMEYDLHYILLRLNGFTSSADYPGLSMMLKIPKMSEIALLNNAFKTKSQ